MVALSSNIVNRHSGSFYAFGWRTVLSTLQTSLVVIICSDFDFPSFSAPHLCSLRARPAPEFTFCIWADAHFFGPLSVFGNRETKRMGPPWTGFNVPRASVQPACISWSCRSIRISSSSTYESKVKTEHVAMRHKHLLDPFDCRSIIARSCSRCQRVLFWL